ncbi:MAG: hypothetical protein DIU71_11655, partial [Proteobacteria bacterium]
MSSELPVQGRALSRRAFMKTASAASGGLVIAFWLPGCSGPEGTAGGP